MTERIKTAEDLLTFLAQKKIPVTTKALSNRMFGLIGSFRDTGARLKHFEPNTPKSEVRIKLDQVQNNVTGRYSQKDANETES
jgi:hypothetical protein